MLQIAEGWTVNLPEEVTDTLMERTNPTWPCTWFTPRCDGKAGSPFESAYSVMQNWGANHGAISYGHVGADLITLCSMLRIPVCMHNVADQDIFRPAAWNAFGMEHFICRLEFLRGFVYTVWQINGKQREGAGCPATRHCIGNIRPATTQGWRL